MTRAGLTKRELAGLRIATEARVLDALRDLQKLTGCDIARVEVFLVVKAEGDGADPIRVPEAVRIELCV
jgi:hypothetical protein